jgi:hypothetical protein
VSWSYAQGISPDGFGLFFIHVWATEAQREDPEDITFFRGVPTVIQSMDFADPFGPVSAQIMLQQCTGFDGPWEDPLLKTTPSETWFLRENVNVDIAWIPATTEEWHAGEQMIINPVTNTKNLYLHEKTQAGAPQPNLWEGFVVSIDPSPEGVSLQCQGALYQLDRYYAKPLNPHQPRSVESMICRYMDPRRRGIYTDHLIIPELSDPDWHILYNGKIERGNGEKVEASKLGSRYVPIDLVKTHKTEWINPSTGSHVKNNRWTGYLTRYSGNSSWDKILTGYIQGQLSYMYVTPDAPQYTTTVTVAATYLYDVIFSISGDTYPIVGKDFTVTGMGAPYDGTWTCTDVVGSDVYANSDTNLGNEFSKTSGTMSFTDQSGLVAPHFRRGDQWTMTLDPGRIPRMYVRRQNAPVTLVAWYGQPGVEARLTRDGGQVANAFYGSGKGANGGGDFTWTRQFSPGNVPWQTFRPIATDPDMPIYHYWDYYLDNDINPPQQDTQPGREPWLTKREDGDDPLWPSIYDLPDGYDAQYERTHGYWVAEKYVQFQDGIDEGTAREVAKAWVYVERDPGWTGDISLRVDLRDPDGSIRSKWTIKNGDIIMLKGFQGTGDDEVRGTNVFHVTGVTMNPTDGSVSLKVDTKFRDLLSVEEAIERGRDTLSPVNSLQVGKRSAIIEDMVVPWNNSRGSGYIPRTAHTTFFNSPFPHVEMNDAGESVAGELSDTMNYPPTGDPVRGEMFTADYRGSGNGRPVGYPRAMDYYLSDKSKGVVNPNYDGEALYIPVNAGAPDAHKNRRWSCVPVLLSAAGTIVRTEIAAYDKDGKLAPVEFHCSFYQLASVGRDDMPMDVADWDPDVTPDPKGTQHSALWDGAFEDYDMKTGYFFHEVSAHTPTVQMLIGWGNYDQPAGYSPKRKIPGGAGDLPTGMLMDSSPWPYQFFGDETGAKFPRQQSEVNFDDESKIVNVSATLCIYARIPDSITDQDQRNHLNWVYFRGRVYRGAMQ